MTATARDACPCPRGRRRSDTERRLAHEVDVWVATASADGIVIGGDVEVLEIDALPADAGDRFAAGSGFDPRTLPTEHRCYRVTPRRLQAWREADGLPERA